MVQYTQISVDGSPQMLHAKVTDSFIVVSPVVWERRAALERDA